MKNEVYLMDCMEYMATLTDKAFDLAIVDPPYGILVKPRTEGNIFNTMGVEKQEWDIAPDSKYFLEIFRICKSQIIWGANYFDLKKPKAIIFWDKINYHPHLGDGEIAFCYGGTKQGVRKFTYDRLRFVREEKKFGKIHPCQKPVALYKWLLQNYAKPGQTIFDSHVGSGSSRIACYDMGFDFAGCELDPDYYQAQEDRFKNHIAQGQLFEVEEIQENIFQEEII